MAGAGHDRKRCPCPEQGHRPLGDLERGWRESDIVAVV
jgi:hypothetical protein